MSDIYGTVADIDPHHRYFIKTQSGYILTHNHHFLRHRAIASLYPAATETNIQPHQQTNAVTDEVHTPQETTQLRRSNRTYKPPSRLVEDPQWP